MEHRIDQLRQSSSAQCRPPHEVLDSTWCLQRKERHPPRRPRNSHSLRCRGLLEVIEGSFHGNTVSLDAKVQSDESSDESCATQRRCSVKDWGVEFVHIPPALQSYPESQWSTVH